MAIIIIILVIALLYFGYKLITAPIGYEDEKGFHLGEEDKEKFS